VAEFCCIGKGTYSIGSLLFVTSILFLWSFKNITSKLFAKIAPDAKAISLPPF